MRDTVLCLICSSHERVHDAIRQSIEDMVTRVARYVPGYRLKHPVQIAPVPEDQPIHTLTDPALATSGTPTHQVSVFLEVKGAAHYLPAYAGNLDIMTSAAVQCAERIAQTVEVHRSRKAMLR
jgi:acetaldehyde dehydrogenase